MTLLEKQLEAELSTAWKLVDQCKRACKELEAKLAAMESQQVMGRVHAYDGEETRAVLNSIGRDLPDNCPLYAKPVPAEKPAVAVPDEISKKVYFIQPDETRELVIGVDNNDCPFFSIGHQRFRLDPNVVEDRDHAKWYQQQLSIAFERLLSAPSHSQQSAKPVARAHVTLTDSWPEVELEILDGSAFQTGTVDLFASQIDSIECDTCSGVGHYDERTGGEFFSNPKAECPDCEGTGLTDNPAQSVVFEWPKPITIYDGLDEPHNYYRPSQIAEALDKAGITKRINPHAMPDRCPSHESEQS